MTRNTTIFSRNITSAKKWNQVRSDSRQAKEKNSTYVSNRIEAKLDVRKTNRGCAMHQNRSSRKKVEFVDEVLQSNNEEVVTTATEYYHDITKCVPAEVDRLRNRISKWSKPDAYGKCLDDRLGHTKSSNVKKRQKSNTASPFHYIET